MERHKLYYDERDRETEAFWWGITFDSYQENRKDEKGYTYSRDQDQNLDDEILPNDPYFNNGYY